MPKTLITGADGYVGSEVARAMLARGDEVIAVVRDPRRRSDVVDSLTRLGATIHVADVTDNDPFAGLAPDGITHIVHAAAVTRFNVDRTTAEAVNVMGARRVLDFATRCPRLEIVGLVSTVYASGLQGGRIAESHGVVDAGFANNYEWSKWEAERVALESFTAVPVAVLRLATIIAEDASGVVVQRNAFHTTLRLVYYGLLSLLPGHPSTPVHLASSRYAVDASLALLDVAIPGTYHLTNDPARPLPLGELIDMAWERFSQEPDFARRRLLPPLFTDPASFEELASASESFGGSIAGQAVATTAPFARQLFVAKHPDVTRTRALLDEFDIHPEDASALARAAIDHTVRTRWGKVDDHAA